jgi:prephenate dehydratase
MSSTPLTGRVVVFSLRNAAGGTGALFKAIACFAMRDLDLTKIESRPGVVNCSLYELRTWGA